jgi:hypothetical protein
MTNLQTRSWIFMATAMAAANKPAALSSISATADYINHAVPSREELDDSIAWLVAKELLVKTGDHYELTAKGKAEYDSAAKRSRAVMKIWELVELKLKAYGE